MHPLNQTLDETSFHRPRVVRRRSSLDNSSLIAPDCFAALLLFPEEDRYDYTRKSPRRLSLGTKLEDTNTTFLAMRSDSSFSKGKNKGSDGIVKDLDSDRHDSNHTPACRNLRSSHSKGTVNTCAYSSDDESTVVHEESLDGDDNDSESSDDMSDCDSFCDASAEEPANRVYLRGDLGASVMWGDDSNETLDFQDSWKNDSKEFNRQSPLNRGSPQQRRVRAVRSGPSSCLSRSFPSSLQGSPVHQKSRRNLSFKLDD